MLCQLVLAIGLSFGCVDQPPARDLAAEAMIEQEKQRNAEFEEAKERRRKIWGKTEACDDCPRINNFPSLQKKD